MPGTLKEILNQQIRKNSKLFNKSAGSISLSLILFVYHLLLIIYPIVNGITHFWIVVFIIKLLFEFSTLVVSAFKLSEEKIIPLIPFFQVLYPPYVSILVFLGLFQLYDWKK